VSHLFRPTPHALGLFFSASGAGLLLGAVVGGRISDRLGRKSVLVASIAAFGLFSLLTSVAPDMESLTTARFLTGLGLGGAMPNLIALAADSSAAKSRNASIAIAFIGMPVGAVAASLIVFFLPLEAWRVVFQVGGAAPLIVAPLMFLHLPATKSGAQSVTSAASTKVNAARELFGEGRTFGTLLLWVSFFLIALTLHLMLNWLPLLLIGRGLLKGQAAVAQAGFNAGGALIAVWLGTLLDSRWRHIGIGTSVALLPRGSRSDRCCSCAARSPAWTGGLARWRDFGWAGNRVCGGGSLLSHRNEGHRLGCCGCRRQTWLAHRTSFWRIAVGGWP
jgi:AAHS family 3-hydroxyphenylpropionic acid transporter